MEVLQLQLPWDATAPRRPAHPSSPSDPAYRWPSSVDVAVREARANGIKVALLVMGSPRWANGGRSRAFAPARTSTYAKFMQAASRRYPSVKHWMIWGEPTRPGNFAQVTARSRARTRLYARLLDGAYGALKAVDRRNIVIGGNTWTFGIQPPPQYIRWLRLPNGKPPRLDLWGHNPFGRRFPKLSQQPYYPGVRDFNDIDTLSREVRTAYRPTGRRPRLWLSEWTIPSDRVSRGFDFFVSRKRQAEWLTAGYRMARRADYVAGLGWYGLLDDPPGDQDGLTTGLMTYDGEQKPAFRAYARAR